MQIKSIVILTLIALAAIWSCDVTETDEQGAIEDAILALIAADDSTYAIEGMDNIDDEDYSLVKASNSDVSGVTAMEVTVLDSDYVWRFGRSGMNNERGITIEIEDDTSAIALITHHITGTFHARQFERVWTSDTTSVRGDSVQFSQKSIDQTINRRVIFRLFVSPAGEERWKRTAMTLAYGSSGEVLNIEAVEWVAEDSVSVLTDFENVFYGHDNPLAFAIMGANRINTIVSNELEGDSELVVGRFGFHPRVHGPGFRNRIRFHYDETLDTGDKVYTRGIPVVDHLNRHFKGFIEVTDQRTLFDHDYEMYTSATVGFVYKMRNHVRD